VFCVLAISALTHVWVEQPIRVYLLKRLGVNRVPREADRLNAAATLKTASLSP
jgi:hypothetical protein